MAGSEVRRFEVWGIAIAAVVILGVLPALNAFVPETNPLHVSNFTINLYGKMPHLCGAGDRRGCLVGFYRPVEPRAVPFLCARRLCLWHVFDAEDWKAGTIQE